MIMEQRASHQDSINHDALGLLCCACAKTAHWTSFIWKPDPGSRVMSPRPSSHQQHDGPEHWVARQGLSQLSLQPGNQFISMSRFYLSASVLPGKLQSIVLGIPIHSMLGL